MAGDVVDSVVQANLVFPQGNNLYRPTYRPVYPFPIVVSVQNAALAWGTDFCIYWDLHDLGTNEWIDTGDLVSRSASVSPDQTDAPDDQWLAISASEKLVNTTFTELKLYLTFSIDNGCDRKQWEQNEFIYPDKHEIRIFHEAIIFKLAPDGDVPDIEAVEPCPTPLGAIWIQDFLVEDGGNACPLLGDSLDEQHEVKQCATSIGPADATKVASEMLAVASCTTGSWPDPKGLVNSCPEDSAAVLNAKNPLGLVWLASALLVL